MDVLYLSILMKNTTLYLGPETIMPIGSFLAAAVGVILVFWRQGTTIVRRGFKRVFFRKSGYSPSSSTLDTERQAGSSSETD